MVIQCKNLISLYILPDQRRVNLSIYIKLKVCLSVRYRNKTGDLDTNKHMNLI